MVTLQRKQLVLALVVVASGLIILGFWSRATESAWLYPWLFGTWMLVAVATLITFLMNRKSND